MFQVAFSYPLLLESFTFTRIADDADDLRVLLADLKDGGAEIEFIDDYKVKS